MNPIIVPFGEMLTGQIDWPINGLVMSLAMLLAFAVLLALLVREARAEAPSQFQPRGLQQHRAG